MTFPPKLQELPIEAKWLITLVLTSFCFNHLAAAALVWEVTRDVAPSAQAHFAYKSFAALLRMTHQHAFGHGTMYFITGAIFLLAGCGRKLALTLITLPFIGAWADVASWFLLKYGSEKWELLSMASGAAYSIAFAWMLIAIFYEMWWVKPPARNS